MTISRRDLARISLPAMAGIGGGFGLASAIQGAEPRPPLPAEGNYEFTTFEDFGAIGDFDFPKGVGTDDTRAIQQALDWAYDGGRSAPRAILMSPKAFLCGPITTYPTTTIIGTGRHTSAFCCREGTTGAWWSDRGEGAQKLMLSGIAWYGRNQAGLSHVCLFGQDGIQFGSEGILQGLWTRDAPNATGLWVNGNVGIVRDLTTQACATGIQVLGNGNHLENIFVMECTQGARLHGAFLRGMHIEATASGGLPLWLNGDCHISDLLFATARNTEFEQLITVETANYNEWSLSNVQFLGQDYRVGRGLVRIGDYFVGGTQPRELTGATFLPALHLPIDRLTIGGQRWHSFVLELRMGRGGLVHRIGASGDPGQPVRTAPDLHGATAEYLRTPVGGAMELARSTAVKIVGSQQSQLLINLRAIRESADQAITCSVVRNATGVALSAWARVSDSGLLLVELSEQGNARPFSPTQMPDGGSLVLSFAGWAG